MSRKVLTYIIIVSFILTPLVILNTPSAYAKKSSTEKIEIALPVTWVPEAAQQNQLRVINLIKQRLKKDPTMMAVLTGHTDTIGSPEENKAIGYYYANRIAEQLINVYRYSRSRIEIRSDGENHPIVYQGSFANQASNRRVILALVAPSTEKIEAQSQKTKLLGKNVLILEPAPGTVNRAYQRIRAVVEGDSKTALLTVNGLSTLVTVNNSRLDAEAVLNRGENNIEVMAWDQSGAFGKDGVAVTYVPVPPEVEIYEPKDGEIFNTTQSPVIQVTGKILSSTPLQESFLFLNGAPQRIRIDEKGFFAQPIVLIRNENNIMIEALDIYGKTAASPEISAHTMNLAPKDMVVFLTWDKSDVDLDLHILGPDGRHTYYAALDPYENSEAIISGELDIDDKDGYGPEVFTIKNGLEGTYKIEAKYHHSIEDVPCMASVTVVLNPTEPARRITRVFGPQRMTPGSGSTWKVTGIDMPDGAFQ